MIVIIGLGNPGKKYEKTRHNAGFMLVDKLRGNFSFPDFEFKKIFNAEVSKGNIDNQEILLLKPRTFVNKSGESVRDALSFYKLSPSDIFVIHDELDIALGRYKAATDSSSAGHNGVQDIIDKIGTQKFKRLRIGIRNEATLGSMDPSDFVLQNFFPEEQKIVEEMTELALQEIKKLA